MKRLRRGARAPRPYWNLWVAIALLLSNGLAWWSNAAQALPPEVTPRLAPEIAEIRDKALSGEHGGETFQIVLTEQMAEEALAWFLSRHPEIPFSHPDFTFQADGLTARGLAHVLGLRTPLHGRAALYLDADGRPGAQILDLGIAGASAPGFVLDAITGEVEAQLDAARNLMVILTKLEMQDGQIVVEGKYREGDG